MSKTVKLGRRGFLGVGAAAAAGVGLGASVRLGGAGTSPGRLSQASVAFSCVDGFPDRPVTVDVTGFDVPDGTVGQVRLSIKTPAGIQSRDVGPIAFRAGAASLETALVYPFEERVPGDYGYHAEVIVAGRTVATREPASYSVRPFVWFS